MLNWINRTLGDHAPMVGAFTAFAFILGASIGYNFVRNFGVDGNGTQSSEVHRDRR
jgi:hypothetical protein